MFDDRRDEQRMRLERIERALEAQKAFLYRIPDPDTRERAEEHLMALVQMREDCLRVVG